VDYLRVRGLEEGVSKCRQAVHDVNVPHRTLRLRHGMQAWYVRVCCPFCPRGGGEAFEPEPACDIVVVDYRLATADRVLADWLR
jgi:hypothetical protein